MVADGRGEGVVVGGSGVTVAVAVAELFLSGFSPWAMEGPQPAIQPAQINTTANNQVVCSLLQSHILDLTLTACEHTLIIQPRQIIHSGNHAVIST